MHSANIDEIPVDLDAQGNSTEKDNLDEEIFMDFGYTSSSLLFRYPRPRDPDSDGRGNCSSTFSNISNNGSQPSC